MQKTVFFFVQNNVVVTLEVGQIPEGTECSAWRAQNDQGWSPFSDVPENLDPGLPVSKVETIRQVKSLTNSPCWLVALSILQFCF